MVPMALVHERDAEAAFNGLLKLRLVLRQKVPVRQAFEFLMNGILTNKLKKKSRKNRYNGTLHRPWCDVEICSQCRFEESDEISALTLLQVCFNQHPCMHEPIFESNQNMAWIEDALKVSDLKMDDLFKFDEEGFVTSCCADFEQDDDEHDSTDDKIFIRNRGCDHEVGGAVPYEQWKENMMRKFEEQWPRKLEEEVFFRPVESIPGGAALLERTKTRKEARAEKFRRNRRPMPDF